MVSGRTSTSLRPRSGTPVAARPPISIAIAT